MAKGKNDHTGSLSHRSSTGLEVSLAIHLGILGFPERRDIGERQSTSEEKEEPGLDANV
jgi:hypothetical protein